MISYPPDIAEDIEVSDGMRGLLGETPTAARRIHVGAGAEIEFSASLQCVGEIRLAASASATLPHGVLVASREDPLDPVATPAVFLSQNSRLDTPGLRSPLPSVTMLDGARWTLPSTVEAVGRVNLFGSASLGFSDSLVSLGHVTLYDDAKLTLPISLLHLAGVEVCDGCELILPSSLDSIGSLDLRGGARVTIPASCRSISSVCVEEGSVLSLPRGLEHVGSLELKWNASLEVPASVRVIGGISVYRGARLSLPSSISELDSVIVDTGALFSVPEGIVRLGTVQLEEHADIQLPSTLSILRRVCIRSYNGQSITLPELVRGLESLELHDDLTLESHGPLDMVYEISCEGGSVDFNPGVRLVGSVMANAGWPGVKVGTGTGVTHISLIEVAEGVDLTISGDVTISRLSVSSGSDVQFTGQLIAFDTIDLGPNCSLAAPGPPRLPGAIRKHESAQLRFGEIGLDEVG